MAAYARCSRDSMQVAATPIPRYDRYPSAEPEDMAKGQPLFPQVNPRLDNTRVSEIESTPHIPHRLRTIKPSLLSSLQPLSLNLQFSSSLQSSPPSSRPSPHFHLSRFMLNARNHYQNISLTSCRSPESHANIGSLRSETLRPIRQ
jgi:hypothetical protein